ncbi:MAG TPA: L-threonylcarbamoyladenylate synthase [Gaiellaceae bacterium]
MSDDAQWQAAVEALRAGEPVILPTDTVYGLVASAEGPAPTGRLYALKGRDPGRPSALLAADLETLLACVPELSGRSEAIVRALLPGPYTLILSNPAQRYGWLTGTRPRAIGVRVPDLPPAAAHVVRSVGAVVSTSANAPGGRDPRSVEEIPVDLRERVGAVVDGGVLPGAPSTVLDFTAWEPRVLREGAASSAEALARVREALG